MLVLNFFAKYVCYNCVIFLHKVEAVVALLSTPKNRKEQHLKYIMSFL